MSRSMFPTLPRSFRLPVAIVGNAALAGGTALRSGAVPAAAALGLPLVVLGMVLIIWLIQAFLAPPTPELSETEPQGTLSGLGALDRRSLQFHAQHRVTAPWRSSELWPRRPADVTYGYLTSDHLVRCQSREELEQFLIHPVVKFTTLVAVPSSEHLVPASQVEELLPALFKARRRDALWLLVTGSINGLFFWLGSHALAWCTLVALPAAQSLWFLLRAWRLGHRVVVNEQDVFTLWMRFRPHAGYSALALALGALAALQPWPAQAGQTLHMLTPWAAVLALLVAGPWLEALAGVEALALTFLGSALPGVVAGAMSPRGIFLGGTMSAAFGLLGFVWAFAMRRAALREAGIYRLWASRALLLLLLPFMLPELMHPLATGTGFAVGFGLGLTWARVTDIELPARPPATLGRAGAASAYLIGSCAAALLVLTVVRLES